MTTGKGYICRSKVSVREAARTARERQRSSKKDGRKEGKEGRKEGVEQTNKGGTPQNFKISKSIKASK